MCVCGPFSVYLVGGVYYRRSPQIDWRAPPNKPTPLGRLDKVNPLLSFAMINSTPSVGRMEWKFPGGFTVKEEAVVSLRATLTMTYAPDME